MPGQPFASRTGPRRLGPVRVRLRCAGRTPSGRGLLPTACPALGGGAGPAPRDTLQLWTQIAGKVRMAKAPMVNHWWHVTFAVGVRGLTTGAIPDGARYFELSFDFVDQVFRIEVQGGEKREIALAPGSIAAFYEATMAALRELEIDVEIWPVPVEIEHVTPFAEDTAAREYDAEAARTFWLQLVQASRVLSIFRGRFAGQVSPVPVVWGARDLAVTRV